MIRRVHSPSGQPGLSGHPWCRITSIVLLMLLGIQSAAATESTQRWHDVDRVVAFGDVHGANDTLMELLRFLEIIDADNRWTGGKTHLVSLGDLLDRGPDSKAAMDLLMRLQQEAAAAGGYVHVVLGNHEVMNLTGDMRYVSAAEYAAFAADETAAEREAAIAAMTATGQIVDETQYPPGYFAHRRAFSVQGKYGSWLLGLPALIVINDSAFVHGGFPDWMNQYTEASVNQQVREDLTRLLTIGEQLIDSAAFPPWHDLLDTAVSLNASEEFRWLQQSPFLGNTGPFWYRGNAFCHRLIEASTVDSALNNFDVKRLVMGHSPTTTRTIQNRFEGKVILADTGMLSSYYRGQPAALVQDSDGIRFAYPERADGEQYSTTAEVPFADQKTMLDVAAWQTFLNTLEYQPDAQGKVAPVTFRGRRLQPVFTADNRRNNEARVAAFLLDQLIGLGMVPPTVERKIEGKSGTLSVLPVDLLNETERVASNTSRRQYCLGLNDYQLMYIFDALIRNNGRTPDSMLYNRADLALLFTVGANAFSNASSFPDYLEAVPKTLPEPLAVRLEAINEDTLQATLGDTLTRKQIRALNSRRQKLLNEWRVKP